MYMRVEQLNVSNMRSFAAFIYTYAQSSSFVYVDRVQYPVLSFVSQSELLF